MGCGLGVTQRYTEKKEIHGGLRVSGFGLGVTQRYIEKKEIHGGLRVAGFGLRVTGYGQLLTGDFELATLNPKL